MGRDYSGPRLDSRPGRLRSCGLPRPCDAEFAYGCSAILPYGVARRGASEARCPTASVMWTKPAFGFRMLVSSLYVRPLKLRSPAAATRRVRRGPPVATKPCSEVALLRPLRGGEHPPFPRAGPLPLVSSKGPCPHALCTAARPWKPERDPRTPRDGNGFRHSLLRTFRENRSERRRVSVVRSP